MKKLLAWCRRWQALVMVVFGLLGLIFDFVGLGRVKESSVPLLLPEVLSPWLSAVAGLIVGWLLFFKVLPRLMIVGRWFFRPAFVCTKRRKFCDLLPEVECCLGFLGKDYREQAASVPVGDVLESFGVPASFSSRVQYKSLVMRLEVLFSKLRKLGVPVPASVEIDSVGDLGRMGEYFGQLEVCMRVCDLDSAREIDPP